MTDNKKTNRWWIHYKQQKKENSTDDNIFWPPATTTSTNDKHTTTELQQQLDNVTEQNRVLEVDHATLKESVSVLQNEAVILTNENKHIRMEFEKVDGDLNSTRSMVEEMNTKITELKKKVKNANDNEFLLQDKVRFTIPLMSCLHDDVMKKSRITYSSPALPSLEN